MAFFHPIARSFVPELRQAIRLLDEPFFRVAPSTFAREGNSFTLQGSSRPELDVSEDANGYQIEVDLPGAK